MQNQRLRPLHNASLVLIAVILMAAAVLLFYGVATG